MDPKRLKRTCAVLAGASMAFGGTCSPAVAQSCTPQQTVAVLDQYCDILPSAGGDNSSTGTGTGTTAAAPLGTVLSRRTVERLRDSGPEAEALLMVSAPVPVMQVPTATPQERQSNRRTRERVASSPLEAPARGVQSLATGLATAGDGVVGGTFRWGLVICTLGLAGMTWFRFRARLRI